MSAPSTPTSANVARAVAAALHPANIAAHDAAMNPASWLATYAALAHLGDGCALIRCTDEVHGRLRTVGFLTTEYVTLTNLIDGAERSMPLGMVVSVAQMDEMEAEAVI